MNYAQYLFSNIWKLYDKDFKKLEYDIQYGFVFTEYDKFINSKFSNLDTGLYKCIDLYFSDKFIINPKE